MTTPTRPLVDAPDTRTVDQLPAPPISEETSRNWWPSYCPVCVTGVVWFPTQKARREFEDHHQHGGTD